VRPCGFASGPDYIRALWSLRLTTPRTKTCPSTPSSKYRSMGTPARGPRSAAPRPFGFAQGRLCGSKGAALRAVILFRRANGRLRQGLANARRMVLFQSSQKGLVWGARLWCLSGFDRFVAVDADGRSVGRCSSLQGKDGLNGYRPAPDIRPRCGYN
jgi:hypothetical protein